MALTVVLLVVVVHGGHRDIGLLIQVQDCFGWWVLLWSLYISYITTLASYVILHLLMVVLLQLFLHIATNLIVLLYTVI